MKACTVAAVSAALFAARVHAEDIRKIEYFADAACATVMYADEMDMCHETHETVNGEQVVTYTGYTCDGAESARRWYSDPNCTTPNPDITHTHTEALDTCMEDGTNRWRKITCPFTKPVPATVPAAATYRAYVHSTSCTGEPQHVGTAAEIDVCQVNHAQYNWTEQTWSTASSERWVRSGDKIVKFAYTDGACGAGEAQEEESDCNVCMPWESGSAYLECPWETTTGAPPQALITAALAVPLAGLLASAVL